MCLLRGQGIPWIWLTRSQWADLKWRQMAKSGTPVRKGASAGTQAANGTNYTQLALIPERNSPTLFQWRLKRVLGSQGQSWETPSLLMLWDHRRCSWERTQKRKLLVKTGVLIGRCKGLTISFCIYHMNAYLAWLYVLTIWVFLRQNHFSPGKLSHWGFGVRGEPLWITFFTVFPLLFLIFLQEGRLFHSVCHSLLSYVNKHPGLALIQRTMVGILSKVRGINTWFYILQIYLTGSCGVWLKKKNGSLKMKVIWLLNIIFIKNRSKELMPTDNNPFQNQKRLS